MSAAAVTVDVHLSVESWRAEQRAALVAGLTASPKSISPLWFYDERGSELFDAITRLPEYYPTRAERALLDASAADIEAATGADTLVELGSGTSDKTRVLLDAMHGAGELRRYVPFDVSEETVRGAAAALDASYPGLEVHAVVGDFHRHLAHLPAGGRRLVAFLGGTIGNLRPDERAVFLDDVRAVLTADDHLLLGVDLVKDVDRLVAAYDDAAGVTAAFNRNALAHLNAAVGADFVPERFDHLARWDAEHGWIDIRLRSQVDQRVRLRDLDLTIDFARHEDLHTEISAKFTPHGITAELAVAGFDVRAMWGAEAGEFLLLLAHPSGAGGISAGS